MEGDGSLVEGDAGVLDEDGSMASMGHGWSARFKKVQN